MRNQRKEVSFRATDGFGRTHTIDVFTEILEGKVEGAKSLVTADGESVVRISKGLYRIVHGSLEIVSNDPEAP